MEWLVKTIRVFALASLGILLHACGGGSEYDGFDSSVSLSDPDAFLKFFNQQADLGGGNYTLVVAVVGGAGQTGTFTVTISRNDGGATQIFNGSWTSTTMIAGSPPLPSPETTCSVSPAAGNRCFTLDLQDASGASFDLTTNPGVDGVLYLVDTRGTAQVVGVANAGGIGAPETLAMSNAEIDETDFASAYYAAIDPGNARDTAQKFWSLHGFDTPGADVHVIFRDSKDLGYGRDMYMRSYPNADCGGQVIAFFVRNFSVEVVEGFAYGPVNLEAAIAEDLDHHIGTNAIEFSRGRTTMGATDTCSAEPIAKFYTYEPTYSPPGAAHPRRARVDLDARGDKAMPQPCISCHGGKLRPLDRNGDFVLMHAGDPATELGDTKSRMQAFEVSTFEFSDQVGYRRVDYEEGLRLMNAAIYCTYPGSTGHPACVAHGGGLAPQGDIGEWSGDFAREMSLGWYGGALDTPGTAFDDSFVPSGWVPSPGGPPVGADSLFRKVIGPNCFVCHGKRGNELGPDGAVGTNTDATDGKEIDFGSWDKFISHADEIERLVFDEGRMPLGLLNYNNFWDDPEKAELLASFISPHVTDPGGFNGRRTDGSGNIILPGQRVVPRAGLDRVTQPNAPITLNANASRFADGYSWAVTASPVGSAPVLSAPGAMRTDFTGDIAGTYTIQLTATSSDNGTSRSDTLTVEVDAGLATAPRDLLFYGDINAELTASCAAGCHQNGGQAGVPVWWEETQPFAVPPAGTPQLSFYEQFLTRVNFDDLEDSLVLKKPSNNHHFGGLVTGFDTSFGVGSVSRDAYDMFVNWISEGAACGGTTAQCVR